MRKIKYLVIHHNGHLGRTVKNIRRSHKARGWSDIGYHYVILEDGTIQRGRPEAKSGAHVAGLNSSSIGICMIGNGSVADFTCEQYTALEVKLCELVEAYEGAKILGHRETNPFLPKGHKPTRKQCPGKLIDMEYIRGLGGQ